jgi:hypothetical protein
LLPGVYQRPPARVNQSQWSGPAEFEPAATEVYTHVFDEDLQRKQEGLAPLAL